jgi:hypothetical protein
MQNLYKRKVYKIVKKKKPTAQRNQLRVHAQHYVNSPRRYLS